MNCDELKGNGGKYTTKNGVKEVDESMIDRKKEKRKRK